MAFYGIPQRSIEFHSILWNCTAFYGIPQHSVEFYDIPYHIKSLLCLFFHFSIDSMESYGKLVPIFHGIPPNDFYRIPYDSTADLQRG
ncbi:hypothetical protein DPMN_079943 [Dreissena polymorpha]|uniref:Uncharacterized protein n=1 Tax=Dreissena polymorpha TaxID=45954 RepID=A0A9D4BTE7_DREPO|nr:hypothetical protein DPMN_079943 [Dreissena polymorpha]